jgi:hypothetical protein
MKRFLLPALVLLAAVFLPAAAYGQGCTMCYTAAAAQSAQGKHALDVGILFLLTPALCIFGGVFYVAWRHHEAPPESDWER